MVSDALRRVMLAADGAGELDGDGVLRGRAEHQICGDVLELTLRLDAGQRVAELAWLADGCPATVAVAALARSVVCGALPDEVPTRLHARLGELGGLAAHEHHAERLLLRALAAALEGGGESTPPRGSTP